MGAVLYEDTLQQIHDGDKHKTKHDWWNAHDVKVVRIRFDGKHEPVPVSFGDYYNPESNRVVDTKRSISEIAKNINGKDHKRFREECKRAVADGYRLIILIENSENIMCLSDLTKWTNEHCRYCVHFKRKSCNPADVSITKCKQHGTRKPIQGERLAKAMVTMSDKYGVRFEFCEPHDAARRICFLLGIDYELTCSDCYRFDNGTCKAGYRFTLIEGPAAPTDGKNRMCEWGCVF